MEYKKIFSEAIAISFNNKMLWWFSLVPTIFLMLAGLIFVYAFYTPVVELYELFARAGSESMTILNLIQKRVVDGATFVVPMLIIFLGITILSKNAIIVSIQKIVKRQPISFGICWQASRGYFGPTVMLILAVVGISLIAHLIEVLILSSANNMELLALASLVMEVCIIFAALFALHYVLIQSDPIFTAMHRSFQFSVKYFHHLLLLFFILLFFALLIVALLGAIAGVSYYISVFTGVMIGMLTMIALVPVNVFLTTLWTLFFLTLSETAQKK